MHKNRSTKSPPKRTFDKHNYKNLVHTKYNHRAAYQSAVFPCMTALGSVRLSVQLSTSMQYQRRVEKNTRVRSTRSEGSTSTGSVCGEGREERRKKEKEGGREREREEGREEGKDEGGGERGREKGRKGGRRGEGGSKEGREVKKVESKWCGDAILKTAVVQISGFRGCTHEWLLMKQH